MNIFARTPLHEVTRRLADVAMGRIPAELCIRDATLVNVCTGELQPHIDVAVACGRIALVGDASHCIGPGTQVIDAAGAYLAPGFIDGHVHVESSMLSVCEYAKAVLPRGTATIIMDPHEITNVLGLDGMRWMLEDSRHTPLRVLATVPSCVPAVPGFEDSAHSLDASDVAEALRWDGVVGMGEMMNFPGIVFGDERPHAIVAETLKAGGSLTGHYAMGDLNKGLNAYIAAGIHCCHESIRPEEALEKMRRGMYAMLREGSAWKDLEETSRALREHSVDSRYAVMVSDDTHPHTLVSLGHMDTILRRAVSLGLNPVTAVQMVTLNVAQCFHLDREIGSVTPGKCADLVLVRDLVDFTVLYTLVNGTVAARDGVPAVSIAPFAYPAAALHSMHVPEIVPEDFAIPAPASAKDAVSCRMIEAVENKVFNYERKADLPVINGFVRADPVRDILKACVIDRHHNNKSMGRGFVKGFGITKGAIASTVSHDAHNLLVVGADDADMALCANTLREAGGGMAACLDGQVLGLVPLPIAGLMSTLSAADTADKVEGLAKAWQTLGCQMGSPFMTMSLLALACLPDLRLTNRGLVDCRSFAFVDLFL